MRVKLLDQAKADLVEIGRHYREIGGAQLAHKMIRRLKKPMLALKDNPGIAPPYELAEGVHRLTVAGGVFYVFYRIATDVEVLHVRRAERESVENI